MESADLVGPPRVIALSQCCFLGGRDASGGTHCRWRVIVSIADSTGFEQRHGLLDVTPDDAANKIIRKLNGALLRGKRVGVKRYDSAATREMARS